MFLTDFASYKTYLDLKNYLYNNPVENIQLNCYYFNYQFANTYQSKNNPSLMYFANNYITRYMEGTYTDRKYGYNLLYTVFLESFMSVLRNYINKKDNLLDFSSDGIFTNNIEWIPSYECQMSKDMFNKELTNIPYADIYLISNRLSYKNAGTITVELALALYLIRKHGSKVFIGGGAINEANNPIVELINAAGREYTDGKLEYLVGTIGINIYNYLKGYEYQNKRSPIERDLPELNLDSVLLDKLGNKFAIELVRGCTQHCPYCCNPLINKYDRVGIEVYKYWLQYINENYCNLDISLYAPELNTNENYFTEVLEYLSKNNIKNCFNFYLNISKIMQKHIDLMRKINISEINTSVDMLFDNNNNRHYNKIKSVTDKIDTLIDIVKSKNARFVLYIVANIPNMTPCNYILYKDIFEKYPEYIDYSLFNIYPSTEYFKHPSKHGIEFIYYKNRYSELDSIKDIIEKIPVLSFRKDIDRQKLTNIQFDILCNMKSKVIYGKHFGFNNSRFLEQLMKMVSVDRKLIDKKISAKMLFGY